MPNNTKVTTNRDRYAERLKAKYPDREFADDEAIFGQANDDYDNYDNQADFLCVLLFLWNRWLPSI